MTDAGEKLRDRLVTLWAALPSKAEHPKRITSVEFTEMCVRAELERVAEIADECGTVTFSEEAFEIAAAIRRRKV